MNSYTVHSLHVNYFLNLASPFSELGKARNCIETCLDSSSRTVRRACGAWRVPSSQGRASALFIARTHTWDTKNPLMHKEVDDNTSDSVCEYDFS